MTGLPSRHGRHGTGVVARPRAGRGVPGGPGGRPVWPRATYDEMLAALGGPSRRRGDPVAVVERLADAARALRHGGAPVLRLRHRRFAARRPGRGRAHQRLGPERRHQRADSGRGRRGGGGRRVDRRRLGTAGGHGCRLRDRRDDGQLHLPLRGPARRSLPSRLGRRRSAGCSRRRACASWSVAIGTTPSTVPCATSASARSRWSRSTPTVRVASPSPRCRTRSRPVTARRSCACRPARCTPAPSTTSPLRSRSPVSTTRGCTSTARSGSGPRPARRTGT